MARKGFRTVGKVSVASLWKRFCAGERIDLLAVEYGHCYVTLQSRFKEAYGRQAFALAAEARRGTPYVRRPHIPTLDVLWKEFSESSLSVSDLGRRYGVGHSIMWSRLNQHPEFRRVLAKKKRTYLRPSYSEDLSASIMRLYRSGMSQRGIAEHHGINQSAISRRLRAHPDYAEVKALRIAPRSYAGI